MGRFVYHGANELDEMIYRGKMASYSGGFNITMPRDELAFMVMLFNMRMYSWIDTGTRAVFFDLVMYNANVNVFFIIRSIGLFVLMSFARWLASSTSVGRSFLKAT